MKRILYLGTDPKEFELYRDRLKRSHLSASKSRDSTIGKGGSISPIQPPFPIVESRELSRGSNVTFSTDLGIKAAECEITHYPVIQIVPRDVNAQDIQQAYADLDKYTHTIFTSKNAVRVFFDHLEQLGREFPVTQVVAVGRVTASYLVERGVVNPRVAEEETQEGIIALLKTLDLSKAYLFIPKSSLSRPALFEFLAQAQIAHHACSVYDTLTQVLEPKPDWKAYDQVIFTSPSTVRAFISIFGCLPAPQQCLAIGPITQKALDFL